MSIFFFVLKFWVSINEKLRNVLFEEDLPCSAFIYSNMSIEKRETGTHFLCILPLMRFFSRILVVRFSLIDYLLVSPSEGKGIERRHQHNFRLLAHGSYVVDHLHCCWRQRSIHLLNTCVPNLVFHLWNRSGGKFEMTELASNLGD